MVDRLAHNQDVVGSSPTPATKPPTTKPGPDGRRRRPCKCGSCPRCLRRARALARKLALARLEHELSLHSIPSTLDPYREYFIRTPSHRRDNAE